MNDQIAKAEGPRQSAVASGFKTAAELLIAIAAPLPFIVLVCGYLKVDQQECNKFSLVFEFLLVMMWVLWRR